jgi:hypothetical protein
MSRVEQVDGTADVQAVRQHRQRLHELAHQNGLTELRVRGDGTLIVHSARPGYRAVVRFASDAADVVGAYVHVITDDVPASFRPHAEPL